MLLYSSAKILRADFLVWNFYSKAMESIVFENEQNYDICKVSEIIIDANGDFEFATKPDSEYLFLPLFGKFKLNICDESINVNQVVYCKTHQEKIVISNGLSSNKADILVLEKKTRNKNIFINIQALDFNFKNSLNTIFSSVGFPNYVGLYDGRQEGFYTLQNPDKNIFVLVINGAFEVENRLLETRDALILNDILDCHFEALSENALLLFLEI